MSGLHHQSGLAEALDLALADHGSPSAVADREVADLVELAGMLADMTSDVRPSDEFRARSRQRLLMHMARSAAQQRSLRPALAERVRLWTARLAAALGALTLAGAAAAGASASALPGDALYPVKQVSEAAALQLAPTESARQGILLHQADTRLDETARLLQQGRDADAATTAAQYARTVAALPTGSSSRSTHPEMLTDQARLMELLQTAPGPARAGLERALSATERHTNAAAHNDSGNPAATETPASRESQHPTEIADAGPAEMRPSVPADAEERGRGNAAVRGTPASSDRPNPPKQPDRAQVDHEPDPVSADDSDAPPPPRLEGSHPAPQVDAKPATSTGNATPHGAAPPAIAQRSRSAPEHSGAAPRPAPAGRGRP